jgi:hypothetical protein
MIPCPSCGTRNRRGSRYCYCCGQPLDVVFNVSCPACDRLNPGGSAFCAFCGAKIAGPLPAGEPAVAERAATTKQPAPMARELVGSVPESTEPPARRQRELPPWLYEQPVEHSAAEASSSDVSSPAPVKPPLEQSKYLRDIPGALPETEGWLSSIPKLEGKPVADQAPQSEGKAHGGCLTLPLLVLWGAIALVLVSGV